MNIKVIGFSKVERLLKKKSKEVIDRAQDGVKNATFFVLGEVKQSIFGRRAEPTSVDTGRLGNSVAATFPRKLEGAVSTNVNYAKFIEFGTSRFPARKHFRNSVNRSQSKVKDIIKLEISKI